MSARRKPGSDPNLASLLRRSGDVGKLIAERSWEETSLGPLERWTAALRSALTICSFSRFPMVIFWGSEFHLLYNDAYVPMLGSKHPRSIGQPAQECWGDIWPVIGPMLEGVLERGEATWSEDLLLEMTRHGFLEEAYFTFSYSPIQDDSGHVGGVFCAVTETTTTLLEQRRRRTLRDTAETMLGEQSVLGALDVALKALQFEAPDLQAVSAYFSDGDDLELLVPSAQPDSPPGFVRLRRADPELLSAAADAPSAARLADRLFETPSTQPAHGTARASSWIAPLGPVGQGRRALLVLALSPKLAADDAYIAFLAQLGVLIAAGVADARTVDVERERADALAALDAAKTAFFTNISHEFRTPLTLMLAPLEDALATPSHSPPSRESLELMYRNARRLLKLVNALLDFSRTESGTRALQAEPLDVSTFTADIAGMFRSAIERGGVELIVDPPALPPMMMDPEAWEQIVGNLLSNALKHTMHGKIELDLRLEGKLLVLSVTDTGSGISPQELPHIFDRFHRATESAPRSHEGTGIGLALVRELTHELGGEVTASSQPGAGSTFQVRVPFAVNTEPPTAPAPGGPSARLQASVAEAEDWVAADPLTTEREPGFDGGARLLVVDDNRDMRAYLRRILDPHYQVVLASGAEEALERARRRPPDLILSDVMMPGVSGLDFTRRLRQDPVLQDIPLILLSARAGPEAAVEALDVGADDYLIKPFSAEELLGRISARLDLGLDRRATRALTALAADLMSVDAEEQILQAVHRHVGELLGNAHTHLALIDENRPLVTAWHVPPMAAGVSDRYRQLGLSSSSQLVAAMQSGEPIVLANREEIAALFAQSERDFTAANIQAAAAVPLPRRDGTPAGAVALSWSGPRRLLTGELSALEEAADLVGQAIRQMRQSRREHEIGDQIQQGLLEVTANSTLAALAVRYRPADNTSAVGGDWYDAFPLGEQTLAVSVGDVVGKGLHAALAMGQLRSALSAAAAVEDAEPHDVLRRADAYAARTQGASGATVVYVTLDEERTLRWCRAGHPPPLVIEQDQPPRYLWDCVRPPLGFPAAGPDSSGRVTLNGGATVLLYTDGLIERPGESLDEGFSRLKAAVAARPAFAVADLCDALVEAMTPPGGYHDDVAIAALRVAGTSATRMTAVYPATAANLGRSRQHLRRWLGALGLQDEIVDDVLLAVGEAFANSVEHATATSPVIVSVEMSIDDDILNVAVSDTGKWAGDSAESMRRGRGNGFRIMHAVMNDVTVRRDPIGTTVTMSRQGTAPAGARPTR